MTEFAGELLAIDAATSTGFCIGEPDGKLTFGSIRFAPPGQARAVAYIAERAWLAKMVKRPRLRRIVYESPANPMIMMGRSNADTIRKLCTMAEIIDEAAYVAGIECREAETKDVRVFFLGRNMKREAAKFQTMQKCREMGYDVQDDDAGDAVALWFYQMSFLRPDLAHQSSPLFYGKRRIIG